MKFFLNKWALCFLVLLIGLCHSCAPKEEVIKGPAEQAKAIKAKPIEIKPVETKPAPAQEKPKEQPVVEKPAGPSTVVGKIGDYVVTKGELEKKLTNELRTNPDEYMKEDGTVNTKAALLKMIAEKAMIIEARNKNYLEDKSIKPRLKQFKEKILVNSLLRAELEEKIKVTESEIDEMIKSKPKLNRGQAKATLERSKAGRLINRFYSELLKKLHVEKVSANFAKVARIHQRLLLQPKEPRKLQFIRRTQIEKELTPEERNMVLAKFDGGKVTLEDWLSILCQHYSPPSRPKDLNTVKGVEKFLDGVMRTPVFVAEAKLRGLDKDENFVRQVRNEEDKTLLRKVISTKYGEIKKPTKEEIIPYFNKNKEKFRTPEELKIDQIWCQDLKTAQKVKDELSSGKDFKSAKQQYSLAKKEKVSTTSASREGIFFEKLWNSEPNEIVGPVKGFHFERKQRQGTWQVKWRIVKILQKKQGREKEEYSSSMEEQVKNRMRSEQREAVLARHKKQLLEKYSYDIYSETIKHINPLNIP